MKKTLYITITIIAMILYSCYKESYLPAKAKFTTVFKGDKQSVPAYIELTNLSKGADTYAWEFEGGTPATATKKDPGAIAYTRPGIYTIKLTVNNIDGETDTYTQKLDIKDAIHIGFTKKVIQSHYPPVELQLTNTTQGENMDYQWTFQNGIPATYTGKTPPDIRFEKPGTHHITLSVSNGVETLTQTDTVQVYPEVIADFDWTPAAEDYDYQAPVRLKLNNKSQYATSYKWTSKGANPEISTETNPQLVYTQAGTYTIQLEASNGKMTRTSEKQLTILPNTGIYTLENIKLGVNYAHNTNTIGAFYSTKLRKTFTANQITADVAPYIDIVFQGQNNNFNYNKFISPTHTTAYGFAAIPETTETLFINSQEICNCGLDFTEAQFDTMLNDEPLKNLNIPDSPAGQQQFGNKLPRVVLFQTQDGRKGAIKIKQFVSGPLQESYILCNIKVQK